MRFRSRRFRFSVRMMLVFVTVVAVYFGSWPWCREAALKDVQNSVSKAEINFSPVPVAPFVITVDQARAVVPTAGLQFRRHYYLWCFGMTIKLPYSARSVALKYSDL